MTIATGVNKTLAFKKQTGLGAKAPAGAGGTAQYMRRVTCTLDLTKASYQSAEILPSQQRRDMRHGVRSVTGSLHAEMSVAGYQKPMESVLRQAAQAIVTTGALTNVTSAATTTPQGTYSRAAGSFFTDGFCVGDVITAAGWTAPALANNAHSALIVALTATLMTVQFLDGGAMVAKAAGDSVTISQAGKKTFIPATGQTRDYYTIEHFFSDTVESEVFSDCVFTGMNVSLPPTGMATVDFPIMGLNAVGAQAQYFTTPAPAPTGSIEAAVNGVLLLNGAAVGIVTGCTFNVNGNYSKANGVVGANVDPDIYPGPVDTTGQLTVLFQDHTIRDLFYNETVSSFTVVLQDSGVAAPGFTAFTFPKVKFSGATKDDTNAALTLTMPFTALENTTTGAGSLGTSVSVQDSAFA
jgi:tail tube protein